MNISPNAERHTVIVDDTGVRTLPPESTRALERAAAIRPIRATRYPEKLTKALDVDEVEIQLKVMEYRISLIREILQQRENELRTTEAEAVEYRQRFEVLSQSKDPFWRLKFYARIGLSAILLNVLIYAISGVFIMNPLFSTAALIACLMLWLMAYVTQKESADD